ncbi:hypothetical protein BH23GEM7_BH23GEM7_30560 [soil metagenome]|nr:hypothetical protein [Gemmatimonadota bacterium]
MRGIRRTAALPAAPESDVVHVAPPTGEAETDRASILAALERVQQGGTVQFAPGTYLIGEIIRVPTPRLTLLGHPDGTTLRGCEPDEYAASQGDAARATDYAGRSAALRTSPLWAST